MSYRDFQKNRWDSLARQFGGTKPLRAVISSESDLTNYYFDKTSRRMLDRSLRLEDKRVLDLGCGIGRLSLSLALKARHVTGIDISEKMVGIARNAAAANGLSNAVFLVYDGLNLPFGGESFDVIVCSSVLKYVIDDADFWGVAREIGRAVAIGGQVVVIDQFDYAGPVELHGEQDIGGMSVLRRPTDFILLFQEHGMKIIEQLSLFGRRFQRLADALLKTLPLGRYLLAWPPLGYVVATVDVCVDDLLRHQAKPGRGFQLLRFIRCA